MWRWERCRCRRDVGRRGDPSVFDDVARTVHELFRDRDAHDEFGARELAEEFVVSADGGLAVKPDPMWVSKSMNSSPTLAVAVMLPMERNMPLPS